MNAETNAVVLKLPTFWTKAPDVWFTQTEAQFNIRKISDDSTRYYYVVASLDQETAANLRDLIGQPPEKNMYAVLKARLLKVYGLNSRSRAARLLDMTGLGDRKPSSLLSEMKALAGGHTSCMLFEEIFLRQMPPDIRLQLAHAKFDDLDALGEYADEIWQAKPREFSVDVVKQNKKDFKSPSREESSKIHVQTSVPNDWCYYHKKFGSNAFKCSSQYAFTESEQPEKKLPTYRLLALGVLFCTYMTSNLVDVI
ncbi:hypothetical protein RF11_01405 [Thelohanellus kitauei]|uniref:DUF7041 domain-containing protein n=1 Tax=Thelohanellus kitauei TaxID=669202 RepID=A0A0C2N6D2_THEKT|nr:hypothetical protein RF11_01405 [Thelohanellus kitauei]